MSQKEKSFQPKRTGGGQKFSGARKSAPAGRGKSFNKDFEGDRKPRSRSGDFERRPPRRDDGGFKGTAGGAGRRRSEGDSFGRRTQDGDRPYRKREFGASDRPARRPDGDRPYKKREFGAGDKPTRRADGDRPFKKRGFEDRGKPARSSSRDMRFDSAPPVRRYDEQAERPDVSGKLKSARPSYGAPSATYLYGVHAVSEALLNKSRTNKRLLCTDKGMESLRQAWDEAEAEGLNLPHLTIVEKEDIERLLPRDSVHQDVLLDTAPLEETFLNDILISAGDNAKIIVLDQVTDPHNVGAILRSASAFGALAVVVQTLHAPDITGVLAKTASGAVEHVPIVREVNLSRALEQMKKSGFFCIGLDERGEQAISEMNLRGKVALVMGAEGPGLRRLVAESCDVLTRLPTQGAIASLNVSNAAAVALYEAVRHDGK